MNKIKKIMLILIILTIGIIMTACTSAEQVGYNLSREADEFKVTRRITFINLRTNEYLFTMTGNCSVQGGIKSDSNELEIVCRIGDNAYQKHMLYIADETTYVIEQLESNDVSRYDYEFVFRPEAIIPVEIKTQVGEK